MKEINPVKVSLGVRPKGGSRVPICGTVVYRCVVVFCRLLVCFAKDVAKPLARAAVLMLDWSPVDDVTVGWTSVDWLNFSPLFAVSC